MTSLILISNSENDELAVCENWLSSVILTNNEESEREKGRDQEERDNEKGMGMTEGNEERD